MFKKAVLMLGIWFAWSAWKRGRVDPMAHAPIDLDAAPLSPKPFSL